VSSYEVDPFSLPGRVAARGHSADLSLTVVAHVGASITVRSAPTQTW
jgi:hypothetical protein